METLLPINRILHRKVSYLPMFYFMFGEMMLFFFFSYFKFSLFTHFLPPNALLSPVENLVKRSIMLIISKCCLLFSAQVYAVL